MHLYKKLIISLLLAIGASLSVSAQGNDPLGGKDTIVLENERLQDVIESEKPFYKADYQQIKTEKDEQITFESRAFYVETDFEPAPPSVSVLTPEKTPPAHNNLIRLGIGRFITPLGQIYLNNGPDKNVDYGLEFTHRSAYRDVIDLRRFNQNYGTARATYLGRDMGLRGSLNINQLGYFNYAGDDTTFIPGDAAAREDSLRMGRFQLQLMGSAFTHPQTDESYTYDVGLRLRTHSDRRNNSEVHFSALPNGSFALTDQFEAGLMSEITYVRGAIDTSRQNRLFLDATPYIAFTSDKVQIKGGFKFAYFNSSIDSVNPLLFTPVIDIKAVIIPEALALRAGYAGNMQHNHYYGMLRDNPYLATAVDIRPTVTRMNIHAGLEGNVGQQVDFAAQVYYKRITDQLIYRTDDNVFFNAVYDSLTTVVGTHIELNYDTDGALAAGAALNVNVYNTANQDSLTPRYFHAPPFRLDVYATYKALDDKLTARGELSLLGPTPMSVDSANEIIRRGLFPGVNVSADYRITDNFSVYAGVGNLLGIGYQRWFNYPERQFDIRGGITLAF